MSDTTFSAVIIGPDNVSISGRDIAAVLVLAAGIREDTTPHQALSLYERLGDDEQQEVRERIRSLNGDSDAGFDHRIISMTLMTAMNHLRVADDIARDTANGMASIAAEAAEDPPLGIREVPVMMPEPNYLDPESVSAVDAQALQDVLRTARIRGRRWTVKSTVCLIYARLINCHGSIREELDRLMGDARVGNKWRGVSRDARTALTIAADHILAGGSHRSGESLPNVGGSRVARRVRSVRTAEPVAVEASQENVRSSAQRTKDQILAEIDWTKAIELVVPWDLEELKRVVAAFDLKTLRKLFPAGSSSLSPARRHWQELFNYFTFTRVEGRYLSSLYRAAKVLNPEDVTEQHILQMSCSYAPRTGVPCPVRIGHKLRIVRASHGSRMAPTTGVEDWLRYLNLNCRFAYDTGREWKQSSTVLITNIREPREKEFTHGKEGAYFFGDSWFFISLDRSVIATTESDKEAAIKKLVEARDVLDQTDNIDDFLEHWAKSFTESLDTRMKRLIKEMTDLRSQLNAVEARYGRLALQRRLYAGATPEMLGQIREIEKLDEVESLTFWRTGFGFTTIDMNAALQDKEGTLTTYYLGKFEVKISFTGAVTFRNLCVTGPAAASHPFEFYGDHYGELHNVCLGGYGPLLGGHLARHDFVGVVRTVLSYLGSFVPDDAVARIRLRDYHKEKQPDFAYVASSWTALLESGRAEKLTSSADSSDGESDDSSDDEEG